AACQASALLVRGDVSRGHSHALEVRSRAGIRAVSTSLAVLLATAVAQVVVYALSGSVALLADLIHNFGDALTAVPLGIAFFLQSVRGERLAGLAVVLAIFISACVALAESIQRLVHEQRLSHLWALAAAGVAGFIGSHLAEALAASGHEVAGVDAFTDSYDPGLKRENAAGLDVRELDLADEALDLRGVDGVFHLAGQPGVRASWGAEFDLYLRRNVLATQRVTQAAAQAGVRLVFASSSSIYGNAERYPTPEDVV